jgi:non-ribosomal peptide synthetase component F
MVILAAVKILLHHCSGQEDIGVRSPVSGRSRPETEGMIGWLANLLVLRTDFQGVADFADALGRVRKVVLEAYEHQDIPFVMLVEVFNHSSKWNDDTPRVVFNMTQKRDDQKQTPQVEGLKILSLAVPRPEAAANNGLAIQVVENERELDISITYRAEAFEAATVTAMLSGLRVILESAVADPHLKFPELLSALPT